jgi:hypothetical protein
MLRLWRFKDDPSQPHPHLSLETFEDEFPPYIALSYTWGSTTVDTKQLRVNQGHLTVTKNLWDFLVVLRSHAMTDKKRFSVDQYFSADQVGSFKKRFGVEQYFWADQVSMNQQDVKERDHQVGLMGTIYAEAWFVFAWLGLAVHPRPSCKEALSQAWDPLVGIKEEVAITLLHLCAHDYWQRLWIVQEVRLARAVILWHDIYDIDAVLFHEKSKWISRTMANSRWRNQSSDTDTAKLLKIFKSTLYPRIDSLLAIVSPSQSAGQLEVLEQYYSSNCSDPRDKFYGLQSLVEPRQRITIDYALNDDQVAIEALKSILRKTPESVRYDSKITFVSHDNWHASISTTIRHIATAIPALSLFSVWAWKMAWSLFVPLIPYDLCNSESDHQRYNCWLSMWKRVRKFAHSKRQKKLAQDLYSRAESHMIHNLAHVCKTPCRQSDTHLASMYEQRALSSRIIEDATSVHGFVMFGDCMFHPDEWPGPEQEHDTVGNFLAQRAWMARGGHRIAVGTR